MQRLTARLLLLFALAGIFVPVALATTAASPHACCIRAAHKCHNLADAESDPLAFRATGCCNHDCCRAVTTTQWAHPHPRMAAVTAQNINARIAESHPSAAAAQLAGSQSTRAPPQLAIA